jgi:hypothetical protein
MSDASKVSEKVRMLAEQAGLGNALKLAPEIVAAAAERGLHPLSKPPAALSPLTTPAAVFDPASFERKK